MGNFTNTYHITEKNHVFVDKFDIHIIFNKKVET